MNFHVLSLFAKLHQAENNNRQNHYEKVLLCIRKKPYDD